MTKICATIALLSMSTATTSASAALVSYYNFNTLSIATAGTPTATGTTTISPTSGNGSLSLAGFTGNVDDFAGSTINAVSGDPAEESLSLISTGATFANGSTVVIGVNLTGYQHPVVTYATQRSSTSAFTQQWAYSIDGGLTYTNIGGTITPGTSFGLQTVDLSSVVGIDNNPNARFRITLSGSSGSGSNNRLDNIQINAGAAQVNVAPVVVDPAPQTVTFGTTVSNGASFSVQVAATDVNLTDVLTLVPGTLPSGISGVTVTPAGGGTSPVTFNVTGTVDYSLNGSPAVLIPFSVLDGQGGSTPGLITLTVVPEPTTLAAIAGVSVLALRRRSAAR